MPRIGNKVTNGDKFIADSVVIHGNKYCYDKVVYHNIHTKVCILCPIHGEFWQTPNNHKNHKQGCPVCAGNNRGDVGQFIANATKIHHRYDYSSVEYINNHTKVCIICPIHGEFWQTPNNHVQGQRGCSKCANNCAVTHEQFISRSKIVHGDKYDYSRVQYKGMNSYITIVCKTHGAFTQKARQHVIGRNGCPKCVGHGDVDYRYRQFMNNSHKAHTDAYDYDMVDYINAQTHVRIVCKTHGPFTQLPNNHTSRRAGCPICSSYGVSNISIEWLNEVASTNHIFIQHAKNIGEFIIPGTRLRVDGYCKETNTVYEFHGDVWHGNPNIFEPNEMCHPYVDVTAGELFAKTIDRENQIISSGYNLVVMWESDYRQATTLYPLKHNSSVNRVTKTIK